MSALHAGGGAKPRLATFAIALSTFTVVTAEMLPVGLLTPIVSTLNATIGRAGLLVSLPALFAALFAPLVVLGARRTDRRSLLIAFLLLLIAANLLAAAATSMALLFTARILLGFCIGGIWAIAGGLAERLVPPTSVGLALSVIFSGVAAARCSACRSGIPRRSAGLAHGVSGRRRPRGADPAPAAVRAAAAAGHAGGGLAFIHRAACESPAAPRAAADVSAGRRPLYGLHLVRPLLQTVAGIEGRWVGPLLFAYGAAGIVGNFIAGRAAAKRLRRTRR